MGPPRYIAALSLLGGLVDFQLHPVHLLGVYEIDLAKGALGRFLQEGSEPHSLHLTECLVEIADLERNQKDTFAFFFDELGDRSEEHTSELQSLMRISYAVFCLKKKKIHRNKITN